MGKRILILDDDTDILSICTYILEELGWEVHTRQHCNKIIEIVSDINPHVIMMDNWIPDTGGIIATQTIKSHPEFKQIPIIYFSANQDIKQLSKEAGADTSFDFSFDRQGAGPKAQARAAKLVAQALQQGRHRRFGHDDLELRRGAAAHHLFLIAEAVVREAVVDMLHCRSAPDASTLFCYAVGR